MSVFVDALEAAWPGVSGRGGDWSCLDPTDDEALDAIEILGRRDDPAAVPTFAQAADACRRAHGLRQVRAARAALPPRRPAPEASR